MFRPVSFSEDGRHRDVSADAARIRVGWLERGDTLCESAISFST